MKAALTACGILAILTLFCIVTVWQVDAVCSDAAVLLEEADAAAAAEQLRTAELRVREAHQLWDSREGLIGMALRHTEADDVGILFPPLEQACREEDREEVQLRCRELIATLEHLSRMEMPYSFNILARVG